NTSCSCFKKEEGREKEGINFYVDNTKKRKSNCGVLAGTVRASRSGVLGFPDRARNDREDWTGSWRSSGGCSGLGPLWGTEGSLAVTGSLAPDCGRGLLWRSRCGPPSRRAAAACHGIRAGCCDQPCPGVCVGTVGHMMCICKL